MIPSIPGSPRWAGATPPEPGDSPLTGRLAPECALAPPGGFPYKIAVLCDLRDAGGRLLFIKRAKEPNKGLYSPIGGKLDTAAGESPAQCARREIEEEAGISVPMERLKLRGIVSEHGYQGQTNWLMFWYRVEGAVEVEERTIREGELVWKSLAEMEGLELPGTDRGIIWPTVLRHDRRGGFFALHLECVGAEARWWVEQSEAGSQ